MLFTYRIFVDCNKFKPVTAKSRVSFQVLFVGALEFKNGIDLFLKLAEQFREKFPETRFVIASYRGSWEQEVLRYAGGRKVS